MLFLYVLNVAFSQLEFLAHACHALNLFFKYHNLKMLLMLFFFFLTQSSSEWKYLQHKQQLIETKESRACLGGGRQIFLWYEGVLCWLFQAPVRRGNGAGLESAEAGGCAVPGCAAGLHRPHQLLPGVHPGSHPGARGCLQHTPPTKVIQAVWLLHLLYCHLLVKPHSLSLLPLGF